MEDSPDAALLTLMADTHVVSPADMERCLREMEAIMVEAAFDPSAPTRVPGPPEGTVLNGA